MSEIIDQILAWPVIVQGALGSGLFWLVLLCGQKTVVKISDLYSHKSKSARISWLVSSQFKHALGIDGLSHDKKAHFFSVLIYRSIRYLYKSLMWLVLGFIANSFASPFGVIGYLGTLFYLFKALEVVSPNSESSDSNKKKLEELTNELKQLRST